MDQDIKPKNSEQILALAWAARIETEERAYRDTGAENHDLTGYCARAAAYLWRVLRDHRIDSQIHMTENNQGCHVFLCVDDWVLDITATQFNDYRGEAVVFLHHREAESRSLWHRGGRRFESDRELKEYQTRVGWPQNQLALLTRI